MIETKYDSWIWEKTEDAPETWEIGIFTNDRKYCTYKFGAIVNQESKWKWFHDDDNDGMATGEIEKFIDAIELINEKLGHALKKLNCELSELSKTA